VLARAISGQKFWVQGWHSMGCVQAEIAMAKNFAGHQNSANFFGHQKFSA
jgi:hypothetical protein